MILACSVAVLFVMFGDAYCEIFNMKLAYLCTSCQSHPAA